MREVVLDSETTGLSPADGDRLISLGCVEMVDGIRTGHEREWVCNPQGRAVGDSYRVHGLSDVWLERQPTFAEQWPEIAAFLGNSRLVIHNARFDVTFLNAELRRLPEPRPAPIDLESVVDTLLLARRLHPGQPAGLDALLARYRIGSKAARGVHGALKDARLLADVYAELRLTEQGGRQRGLALEPVAAGCGEPERETAPRPAWIAPSRLTEDDRVRHAAFVDTFGPDAIWTRYRRDDARAA